MPRHLVSNSRSRNNRKIFSFKATLTAAVKCRAHAQYCQICCCQDILLPRASNPYGQRKNWSRHLNRPGSPGDEDDAKMAGNSRNWFKKSKDKDITRKRSFKHRESVENFLSLSTSDFIASYLVLSLYFLQCFHEVCFINASRRWRFSRFW